VITARGREATMSKVEKTAHYLTTFLDGVLSLLFAAIIVITILQVVLRYLFNNSILGGVELMEGVFIYTTALGAAVAIKRRQHIGISVVVELLPPIAAKIMDIVSHLCIIFLNVVMIYYSVGWISKVGDNESPVLRLPEWFFQISIPSGCLLVIVFCLGNIVLTASSLHTGREESC
jgi:TRAP-type C4-dicarboxylate transport system permease small subunit